MRINAKVTWKMCESVSSYLSEFRYIEPKLRRCRSPLADNAAVATFETAPTRPQCKTSASTLTSPATLTSRCSFRGCGSEISYLPSVDVIINSLVYKIRALPWRIRSLVWRFRRVDRVGIRGTSLLLFPPHFAWKMTQTRPALALDLNRI